MEVDHLLKTRADWEEHYRHRLQFHPDRVNASLVRTPEGFVRFDTGGAEYLRDGERDFHYGLMCGSLFGNIRNVVGVTGASLLLGEDEDLLVEIVDTVAELGYRCAEMVLATGAKFDFAHFWEDICFKNGPLVIPDWFGDCVGPHYKRITDLVRNHGIDIVSLDCDGCIDSLAADLAGERREHDVSHRGRHLGGEHRAVARAVRPRVARRGGNGQARFRAGPRGGGRGGGAPEGAGGAGRVHPVPRPPHRARREV